MYFVLIISVISKLTIHSKENSALTRSTVKEIICMVMCAVRNTTGISFSAGNNLLTLGFFVIYVQSFKDEQPLQNRGSSQGKKKGNIINFVLNLS